MKKIIYGLFFGDSITYGEYDGVFGGWVDILKRYALQNFPESNNELILFNLGIGGETSADFLKRINPEMSARNSAEKNVIFLGYGANDLAMKEGAFLVNEEDFKKNMSEAVARAQLFSNDIFLVNILPFSKYIDGVESPNGKLRTNENVLIYNQILEDIATEYSIGFVDFYSALCENKEIFLSKDGVHPNEKGYEAMAYILKPLMDKFIRMTL
ncbi:SGNH/GDSL hydrolase family protein [Chryseobacterium sp.]|uniref:SGNH/GDSL hydrolase family protein n=1 Tax=Chryseobacterium sp. TaxID=1871047 RepID=UPI00388DE818